MTQTLSVIKAGIGGWVGHSAVHPDVLEATREALARAVQAGTLTDAQAHTCGDDVFLVLSHEHGQDSERVHRLAWETLTDGAEAAAKLQLHGPGQDLLADSFSGNVNGAGPGVAEIELVERASEPVVVFLADKAAAGSYNQPLYRMFADPSNTPGLVLAEALHQGFAFEVHDVREHTKIMLTTPDELHDLLLFIGQSSRYRIKRVITRATGEVAAATTATSPGTADPAAIVRCQGAFPALGEVLEPFATPILVEGALRDSHVGPWLPVAEREAATSRFDGPSRVVALGFQLASGKLGTPRDLFDDRGFDRVRDEVGVLADALRQQGPFEPHRVRLEELEGTARPAVAERLAYRWTQS